MGNQTHRITLRPTGVEVRAAAGTSLREPLFEQGVEFPCGGQGRCRGCRIQVLEGEAAINAAQRERLSAEELQRGWRLACQCSVESDLIIELRQWDSAILADETPFAFEPRVGLGVAVDVGTTTLVAQLLDLRTGCVLAVRTALNSQGRHGGDVMSRIEFALSPGGLMEIQQLIRRQVGALIAQLLVAARAEGAQVRDVVLVGNTAMHHLFSGIDVEPLSHYPFNPIRSGLETFSANELGWEIPSEVTIRFLPCLGGFVGSDILAGLLATRMSESAELIGLIDLGTNGEIVLGNRERILCASTAAGPAFEGARISMGMRASSGAISEVVVAAPFRAARGAISKVAPSFRAARAGLKPGATQQVADDRLQCHVLGNSEPQGICGSGLVDAVAAGLELGIITSSGRFADGRSKWELVPPITLTQPDVRELQLAKAAIASGLQLLRERWGGADPARLYLAGAFGNYVNRASAQRIGLINYPPERVQPAGNTALLGAKLALFRSDDEDGSYQELRRRVEHVGLSADPHFQDAFVQELSFSNRTYQEDIVL